MAHKQDGTSLPRNVSHLSQAFSLKRGVADSKDFVHQQNFWLKMRCDGKGQANVHSAGIALDGRVQELVNLSERYYFIELGPDFATGHPKDRAIYKHVLTARQFWLKSSYHLQQTSQPASKFCPAARWFRYPT
jgi:hypothetical protein